MEGPVGRGWSPGGCEHAGGGMEEVSCVPRALEGCVQYPVGRGGCEPSNERGGTLEGLPSCNPSNLLTL